MEEATVTIFENKDFQYTIRQVTTARKIKVGTRLGFSLFFFPCFVGDPSHLSRFEGDGELALVLYYMRTENQLCFGV
jgi:hypothetical protein